LNVGQFDADVFVFLELVSTLSLPLPHERYTLGGASKYIELTRI